VSGNDSELQMRSSTLGAALTAATLLTASGATLASAEEDRATVAALDTKYQEAVKANDAETMGKILHEDFILVLGSGRLRR
jgi:hypothetical protein